MTYTEIKDAMKSTGLPCTYWSYPENSAPSLPYLIWYIPSEYLETADDTKAVKIARLNVELYTDKKDFDLEEKVENTLIENEILFDKSTQYLKDEQMWMNLYESEVIIA